MTTKNRLFKSTIGKIKNISKIFASVAFLMIFGLITATDTFAQRNQSICERNGYYDTRVNLDGIWSLTFYGGDVKHEMVMAISRQAGVSVTRFYNSVVFHNLC